MAAGVWFTFEFRVAGMDAAVHLVPMLAIAALLTLSIGRRLPRPDGADSSGASVSLAILGAAFLAPTLAWTLPLLSALGLDRFLYEVFLVGADYQTLYYEPHPPAEPYALMIVATLVAVAAAGRFVAHGRVRPLRIIAAVFVIATLTKVVVFREGLAPEGFLHSIIAQLENASYWLAAATSYGALAWLWRVPGADLAASPRARAMLVLVPIATAMYMQMFPRSDFMHQITSVPLTAVVACGLLDRVARWWSRGLWPDGWHATRLVRMKVAFAAGAIIAIAFLDKVGGPAASLWNAAPQAPMPPRLDVRVEAASGDELESIAAAVEFLRARTKDGEALWSFPATSGILFAADRPNVAPHDYWYPGRPDETGEKHVLEVLAASRPRFVVTLNKGWNFFDGSPAYFRGLGSFVGREYRLAARFGRYDVLGRRDVVDGDASLPVVAAPVTTSAADRDAAVEPNLERRRQAAWRWMQTMKPEDAREAALPEGRRDRLLLLRALRDGGDMRGAAWAVLGYSSEDARVRREAVDAMFAMLRALDAEKARFASDYDAARYRAYVAPVAGDAGRLREVAALRPFADAVLELAAP